MLLEFICFFLKALFKYNLKFISKYNIIQYYLDNKQIYYFKLSVQQK